MSNAPASQQATGLLTIVVADDHALVRTGICMMLRAEPDMQVVGEAGDGAHALELARRLRPQIVLADISMPPPDGIQLARALQAELPATKTIVVTMHNDPTLKREALAAGAAAYVTKSAAAYELVDAIRAVAAGRPYPEPAPG